MADGRHARRPSLRIMFVVSVVLAAAVVTVGARLTDPGMSASAGQARADLPRVYADGCHLDYGQADPRECVGGATRSGSTVMLFGDSHAAHWFPTLDLVSAQRGWRLVSHTKSACTPFDTPVWESTLGREFHECEQWRDAVMRIIESERPSVVILASSRRYLMPGAAGPLTVREDPAAWQAGMTRALTDLADSVEHVVLIAETPWLGADALECRERSSCPQKRSDVVDDEYAALETAAANAAGAHVITANEWLCDASECGVFDGPLAVYRDQHHLTVAFAESLADRMDAAIAAAP